MINIAFLILIVLLLSLFSARILIGLGRLLYRLSAIIVPFMLIFTIYLHISGKLSIKEISKIYYANIAQSAKN